MIVVGPDNGKTAKSKRLRREAERALAIFALLCLLLAFMIGLAGAGFVYLGEALHSFCGRIIDYFHDEW